jgi:hypothetical protein
MLDFYFEYSKFKIQFSWENDWHSKQNLSVGHDSDDLHLLVKHIHKNMFLLDKLYTDSSWKITSVISLVKVSLIT